MSNLSSDRNNLKYGELKAIPPIGCSAKAIFISLVFGVKAAS
jgi:hypothetical protein